MFRILADFGRLLLLILFLPLFIIFIGPLLILAVLRGRQPAGPIVLNTSRSGPAGRLAMFFLGLLLSAVTWGGLAWLAFTAAARPSSFAAIQFLLPPATAPVATFTPTSPPEPATATSTAPPATPTSTVSPATPTVAPPSPTLVALQDPVSPTPAGTGSSLTPPATLIPTATPATPAATSTRLAAGATASASAVLEAEPALNAAEEAVAAVIQGNLLLQKAIISTTEENLQNLELIWRGQALRVTRIFVDEVNKRYARPLTVEFDYISAPELTGQNVLSTATVISRENWRYSAPGGIKDESFEFTYSVTQEDGRWVISSYTFRNLATPAATAAPASPTPTGPG